jgi:hypothetical protein
MSRKVSLKKEIADNWKARVDLELGTSQEDLMASNLYSVVKAQFNHEACSLLPDIRHAENKGQGAGSLNIPLHGKSQALGQRLWTLDAEQGL